MRQILLCALLPFLAACGSQGKAAFECPDLSAVETATTIREDPEQVAELADRVASGTPEGLKAALGELGRRHPDVSADGKVDYLLAVSCPVMLGKGDLADSEKTARFDEISDKLAAMTSAP